MSTIETYKAQSIRALHDHILVKDMNFNERFTQGGIVLPGDDAKSSGIRPRWAEVYAVGPKQKVIKVGQYVLVSHGRWTRGVNIEVSGEEVAIRRVDNNDILLQSDEPQYDDSFSTATQVDSERSILEGTMHNS